MIGFVYVIENINETKSSQLENLLPQNIDKNLLVDNQIPENK